MFRRRRASQRSFEHPDNWEAVQQVIEGHREVRRMLEHGSRYCASARIIEQHLDVVFQQQSERDTCVYGSFDSCSSFTMQRVMRTYTLAGTVPLNK